MLHQHKSIAAAVNTWLDHCLFLSSELLQVNTVIYCMFHLLVEHLLSVRSQIADRVSILLRYLWLTAWIAFLRGQHVTEQLAYYKPPHAVGVSSCLVLHLWNNPCSWGACSAWAMLYTYPRSSIFLVKQLFPSIKQKIKRKITGSWGKLRSGLWK